MNIFNLKKEMKNIIYSDSSLSKNSIRDRNSALNKIFENFNNLDDVSVITKDKILDNLNSIKIKTKLSLVRTETDRKSTRLKSSHVRTNRMPSAA